MTVSLSITRQSRHRGPALVQVKDGLWRVADGTGAIVGHIERRADVEGDRFVARRISLGARTLDLGTFWRIDEATDCFRS